MNIDQIQFSQIQYSFIYIIPIQILIFCYQESSVSLRLFQNLDLSRNYSTSNIAHQCLQLIIKKQTVTLMSRRFLRHFFDFNDPFFFPSGFLRPPRIHVRALRPMETNFIVPRNQPRDPHEVFDNFFNENGITENEKDFFKKNFPEKVEEKFDPFKVLEVDKEATEDQIKEAYRKLAIQYHPKNNTSPEAEAKFAELGRAYEEAISARNEAKFTDLGIKSFFEDFDKQAEQIFGLSREGAEKKIQGGKRGQQISDKKDSYGELYSQSSHIQNINGKQTKFVCEKKYKKDGQVLSVKREETLKDDGKTEILETIDDGKQVKKKQYTLDKEGKQQTKKIEQNPTEKK